MFYDFIVWENTNLDQITHSQTSFSSQMTKQSKSNKSHIFSWKYFSFVSPQQLELSLTNIKLSIIFYSEPGLMFVRQSSFYWTQQWWYGQHTISPQPLHRRITVASNIELLTNNNYVKREVWIFFSSSNKQIFLWNFNSSWPSYLIIFWKTYLFYLSWFIVFTLQYQFPDVCI